MSGVDETLNAANALVVARALQVRPFAGALWIEVIHAKHIILYISPLLSNSALILEIIMRWVHMIQYGPLNGPALLAHHIEDTETITGPPNEVNG